MMSLKALLVYLVTIFVAMCSSLLCVDSLLPLSVNASYPVKVSVPYSFVDSLGIQHLVGTIRNEGYMPIQVLIALKTEKPSGYSDIVTNTTLGRTIYPFTESPFKLDIGKDSRVSGLPYVKEVTEVTHPYYEVLTQNYTTMNATVGKNLVGVIKNEGSIALHNVSVYASVHQEDGAQVDSVKTVTIPLLRPGQEVKYVANPDPAVQSMATYFSCAGFDIDAPITTLDVGDGKFIPYTLESAAKIIDFNYNKADDSLTFSADHYNPSGGIIKLSIPEASDTHILTILLDGKIDQGAKIEKNGKTISTEIFVPPEIHEIKIIGVLTETV
jgi:hypothetical protein